MEKRILFILLAAAMSHQHGQCQIQKGSREVSCSVAFGSITVTSTAIGLWTDSVFANELVRYTSVMVRAGYLLSGAFELEPEIHILIASENSPVFAISANVLYNVRIRRSRFIPFALLGIGHTNRLPTHLSPSYNVGFIAVNAGCGIRLSLRNNLALRAEYRMQEFVSLGKSSASSADKTTITNADYQNLLFGLSLFF